MGPQEVKTSGLAAQRAVMGGLQLWLALLAVNGTAAVLFHAGLAAWPVLLVAATLVSALLVLGWCLRDRSHIGTLLSSSGFRRDDWWLTPVVFLGLGLFMTAYLELLGRIGARDVLYLPDFTAAGWPLWTAFVLMGPVTAVLEELAFRGVIQGRLQVVLTPAEACLVQAGMFSVLHLMPLIFASHFVFGYVVGRLVDRTRSLLPGMIVHTLWNTWVLATEWLETGG